MKFGLHIGQQNISMAEMRKTWTWADTAGFDWVDVWDHFYEAPPVDGNGSCFEATTCMAAMACETKNVRIGVLVLGMNYRHPAILANALVTIDHLSAGRLEIGLGAGWHQQEYAGYGIPFLPIGQRMDILEEGVKVVRMLTTQDRSDFQGKHFQLNNAACNPKPVQARPRIWVGGNGEKRTLRIAARHADGWNTPYPSVDEFKRLQGVLDMWCEKEGRDPATIERNVNLSFHMAATASDLERTERQYRETWGPASDAMRGRGRPRATRPGNRPRGALEGCGCSPGEHRAAPAARLGRVAGLVGAGNPGLRGEVAGPAVALLVRAVRSKE
ncbi:MAG: TIGR03560 family F420-dependent LLM class oxidoreductase [Dehalococcoidia bacterium]|nr:TIGR03560 family F420-dependent LLM class oxidoreductase [Dehalococcoidia bacterium]